MKKYISFVLIAFMSLLIVLHCTSCKNNKKYKGSLVNNVLTANDSKSKSKSKEVPIIEFKTTEHNFGDIISGESIKYSFKFKNTGNADLIISSVDASCGCTIPHFTKKTVKPGEEGFIDVTFDSKGIFGYQNKVISVVTNTIPNIHKLYVKANVKRGN